MKRENRFQRNEVVSFNDSDYMLDQRVDPLTTSDQIKMEIQEIERALEEREALMAEKEKKKAEEDAAELARLRVERAGAGSAGDSPQPRSGMADPS